MGNSTSGFASMSEAQRKLIASMGGKAAHAKGTARKWTTEEARVAGRKGGLRSIQKAREKRAAAEAAAVSA